MVARAFLVDVPVMVPAAMAGHNEARPGVGAKQIARQNQTIADGAGSVALLVLVRDGENFGHARIVHDRPRAPVIFVIIAEAAVETRVAAAQRFIELLQPFPAAPQRLFHSLLRRQIARAVPQWKNYRPASGGQ